MEGPDLVVRVAPLGRTAEAAGRSGRQALSVRSLWNQAAVMPYLPGGFRMPAIQSRGAFGSPSEDAADR